MVAVGVDPGEKRRGAALQLAIERGGDRLTTATGRFRRRAPTAGRRPGFPGRSSMARRSVSWSTRRASSATAASRSPDAPAAAAARAAGRDGGRGGTPAPPLPGAASCSEPAVVASQRRNGSVIFGSATSAARYSVQRAKKRRARSSSSLIGGSIGRRFGRGSTAQRTVARLMRRIGRIAVLLHRSTLFPAGQRAHDQSEQRATGRRQEAGRSSRNTPTGGSTTRRRAAM